MSRLLKLVPVLGLAIFGACGDWEYYSDGELCEPGSKRCGGSGVQRCESDGDGFNLIEFCDFGCKDAQCLPEGYCEPNCYGMECGLDPVCGQSCGTCPIGFGCWDGECQDWACEQDCSSVECGPDPACGELCGACESGFECYEGRCEWNRVDGMVYVDAGYFEMGCDDDMDKKCEDDEIPIHDVYLDAFYIDKHEVTQMDYLECVNDGDCGWPSCNWNPYDIGDHPVVCVDYYNAKDYCSWAGKRLPTEAEWEKAARSIDKRIYPWGSDDPQCSLTVMAGCDGDEDSVCSRSPVGDSYYGACDMAGNVMEWVSDYYGSSYYSVSTKYNPTGPSSGSFRVARGGHFSGFAPNQRVTSRSAYETSMELEILGFRCAMRSD